MIIVSSRFILLPSLRGRGKGVGLCEGSVVGLKYNNIMTNNQINSCQHVQLGGIAFYDESKYFLFSPDDSVPDKVQRMRRMHGVAQQMTDGTFDFVAQPRVKSQSKLIRKLAHGRVSKTKDGAIQLTLKITANENINIAQAIAVESAEATDAIVEYQLRR